MAAAGRGAGRLLVVGRNSFIARHFLATRPEAAIAVGHDAIDRPDLLHGIDRIISFARHPLLGREDYRPATMDPDFRLARRIAGRAIDYVMLSSRKVYAPSPGPLAESAPVAPQDCTAGTSWRPSRRLASGWGLGSPSCASPTCSGTSARPAAGRSSGCRSSNWPAKAGSGST